MQGPPSGSAGGGLQGWIEQRPAVKEFLALWKNMRDRDETDWDLIRVLQELKTEYDLPFNTGHDNLGRVIRKMFPRTPEG